jgi:hypothetical protein
MAKPERDDRAGAAARQSSDSPTRSPVHVSDSNRPSGPLLARILDTPQLARVIPQLPPEILHRVIDRCGLEDCAEIVALTTPAQLADVFDLDLWRSAQPGLDERFDADRFGVWLAVLAANDPAIAAQKVASMDTSLLVTAFAQHVKVYDQGVLALTTDDGNELEAIRIREDVPTAEIGGCLVVARRDEAWDAIVEVLMALHAHDIECFARIMRGCRRLSNSLPELDGLDDLFTDRDQAMFDQDVEREQRRERKGYTTPAQARAFLQSARELDIGSRVAPPANPIALAYFAAGEHATDAVESRDQTPVSDDGSVADDSTRHAVAEVVDVLREAGVIPQPPRALLEGPQDEQARLERIRSLMQCTRDRDQLSYFRRGEELAYLANVLVAGCSIQARPMTADEASGAAIAVCNLGIENWPPEWSGGAAVDNPDFLVTHDLIRLFEIGWTVLYRDVCLRSAKELVAVLDVMRIDDPGIARSLRLLTLMLVRHVHEGAPWRARDEFEVLNSLDTLAWAGLLGLIDECPVLHAAVRASTSKGLRRVSPSDFEFISTNSQVESAREFMRAVPEMIGRV